MSVSNFQLKQTKKSHILSTPGFHFGPFYLIETMEIRKTFKLDQNWLLHQNPKHIRESTQDWLKNGEMSLVKAQVMEFRKQGCSIISDQHKLKEKASVFVFKNMGYLFSHVIRLKVSFVYIF